MHRIRGRLTYANVISSLALFLVLAGGTAFAASGLGKNSVGAKQLRPDSVTAAKIKDGAITPSDLSSSAKTGMTGPQGAPGAAGPQGPAGPQGAAGSAKAWAEITSAGTIGRTTGLISVTRPTKAYYCITAGPFDNSNSVALATPNYSDPETSSGDTLVVITTPSFNDCPKGQFGVRTYDEAGSPNIAGFVFMIP
jgi:hypothetical protein